MSFYSETVRKWAANTRRAGILDHADGTGEVGLGSGEAGRRLAVRFTLQVENDRVADARYQVFGCGFSMAACAVAADIAVGYALDELEQIDSELIDCVLEGLPEERGYCAELAVEGLHAAARSALDGLERVDAELQSKEEHGARVASTDPLYRMLIDTPRPIDIPDEDRHLFACLLTVAATEAWGTAAALGLKEDELDVLLSRFFPNVKSCRVLRPIDPIASDVPEPNPDVLSILHAHLDPDTDPASTSMLLARILATRAALPGHLWVAMGLTERPQLSAAIRRHLPSLGDANSENMRWKRYLYKQVCDLNGGTLCKAPNCGVCSDYAICFAD